MLQYPAMIHRIKIFSGIFALANGGQTPPWLAPGWGSSVASFILAATQAQAPGIGAAARGSGWGPLRDAVGRLGSPGCPETRWLR